MLLRVWSCITEVKLCLPTHGDVNNHRLQRELISKMSCSFLYGFVHRESVSIIVQQDAAIHSLLFPANCSTCFGWYLHPSSGAHVNCNYSIWHWLNRITTFRCCGGVGVITPTPPWQRKVANTVQPLPDAVITVWVCSWWWMTVSSETCRAVCRNIIKLYIVAFCWTIIDINSRCTDP